MEDWFKFLSAYHEAVLGWVGGSVKVDDRAPAPDAVYDRLALIRHAMDTPLAAGLPLLLDLHQRHANKCQIRAPEGAERLRTPCAARQELWWPLART